MVRAKRKPSSTGTSEERSFASGIGKTTGAARSASPWTAKENRALPSRDRTDVATAAAGLRQRGDRRAHRATEPENPHCGGHFPLRDVIEPLQKQKPEEKEKRERLETFPLSFGVNTAAECTTRLGRPQHQSQSILSRTASSGFPFALDPNSSLRSSSLLILKPCGEHAWDCEQVPHTQPRTEPRWYDSDVGPPGPEGGRRVSPAPEGSSCPSEDVCES
jgi:hypothetical protein